MNGWMDGWMAGWLDKWIVEWMDAWILCMDGCMDGWMNGQMNGWIDEWMDGCMYGWMIDGWIDGWMDRWMIRWMDRWIWYKTVRKTLCWPTALGWKPSWISAILSAAWSLARSEKGREQGACWEGPPLHFHSRSVVINSNRLSGLLGTLKAFWVHRYLLD